MSINYKSLLIFSCPRSSLPTLLSDSRLIIQSDRRGNALPSNQMTSKFLTEVSWRLYEIRQPPISLQIRPLNNLRREIPQDRQAREDRLDGLDRQDR